jgi:hypothetical protein
MGLRAATGGVGQTVSFWQGLTSNVRLIAIDPERSLASEINISALRHNEYLKAKADPQIDEFIPIRISTDLCGLVSARGVAQPQAVFQTDAAARKA